MPGVMIVDDAAFMRASIKKILEAHGFTVVGEASNGVEAIELANQLQPDLITMDITMPQMDGITATKEIVKNNPDVKICMVSAMGQEVMVRESILAGANNFLVKPFKEEKVVETLKAMI
jgi:two-component system chemotaxis response regulator CheY